MEHLLNRHCGDVKILAVCANGEEALAAIARQQPDILFLDIEMPGMNGFELLEKFSAPQFEIIFTTAYNEYAIKAIKHSALDYLLKPVDKDELIHTVQRAREHKARKVSQRVDSLLELLNLKKKNNRFAVPTMEGLIMVDAESILYCESDSAYCKIFFAGTGKPLVISKTLKEVEEIVRDNDFFRIHHSYLINMRYFQKYIRGEGGEVVLNNGLHLPVSRTKKQEFLTVLNKM